jgi:hypothetical protein
MKFLGAKFEFTEIDNTYPSEIRDHPDSYSGLCSDKVLYMNDLQKLSSR